MKKIILAMSLISILSLTACNEKSNLENTNPENTNESEIIITNSGDVLNNESEIVITNSGDNLNNETTKSEEELIAAFKLSDNISLSYYDDKKEGSLYNLYNNSPHGSYEINISGETHTVSTKVNDDSKVVILIDNKEITSAIDDEYFSDSHSMLSFNTKIGVIHLENTPYIIRRYNEGSIAGDILYSITDNLELKRERNFNEIYKIGEKYIVPEFFEEVDADHYSEGIVIAYWYYENGEWKYINRSINGKILVDDEGNLSEDLNIEGTNYFGPGEFHTGFYVKKYDSEIELVSMSKFRFRKVHNDLFRVFDIEMLEDSVWGVAVDPFEHPESFDENGNWIGEIQNVEYIPKGTIVENVEIH